MYIIYKNWHEKNHKPKNIGFVGKKHRGTSWPQGLHGFLGH